MDVRIVVEILTGLMFAAISIINGWLVLNTRRAQSRRDDERDLVRASLEKLDSRITDGKNHLFSELKTESQARMKLETHVNDRYVTKHEFHRTVNKLEENDQRIGSKLDAISEKQNNDGRSISRVLAILES